MRGTASLSLFELSPDERLLLIEEGLEEIKPLLNYALGSVLLDEYRPYPEDRYIRPFECGPGIGITTKVFALTAVGEDRDYEEQVAGTTVRHRNCRRLLLTTQGALALCIARAVGDAAESAHQVDLEFSEVDATELHKLLWHRSGAYLTDKILASFEAVIGTTVQTRRGYLRRFESAEDKLKGLRGRVSLQS